MFQNINKITNLQDVIIYDEKDNFEEIKSFNYCKKLKSNLEDEEVE
jgi:hypothetical protein